eukprot:TRINITY_DN8689_c0_g1_i1.p1 TRINITY_DN8689_c0_g1~~TRINITY_DN8689_c0_g1_i1.p1  ORF type:complete len:299 (+),score=47.05 TRINITY_DN8689_c0_g1_i1:107-1003(+)
MRVGFIGLGNMGWHMASNLVQANLPVAVYSRNVTKRLQFQSKFRRARIATSVQEIASVSEVVCMCLSTPAASKEVVGALGSALCGSKNIVIDHSTVDPETSRWCAEHLASKGHRFLDAPISGGPDGAQSATLSIMVGGDKDSFVEVQPVLLSMGRLVLHMGGPGAGTISKLVNQLLVAVHTAATAEAVLLASLNNIHPPALMQVLRESWGHSKMLERNGLPMFEMLQGKPLESGAPIRNLDKDASILCSLASSQKLSFPQLNEAARLFADASAAGFANADISSVVAVAKSRNGNKHDS